MNGASPDPAGVPMGPEMAEGEAWFAALGDPALVPTGVVFARVRFVAGARTRWHRHEGAQIIRFEAGSGFVEMRGAGIVRTQAGDTVTVAPGVWHRHGAAGGCHTAHITVTWGATVWEEPAD
ncbi:cupin domain-containing protein [Nonomuraea sp. NPDC049480]|uniref:cupin domain-containing protein n=1 Tax=Nonomuraea sp. NPDC049480 TaxID=3364353 RepID=UPI0037A3636C